MQDDADAFVGGAMRAAADKPLVAQAAPQNHDRSKHEAVERGRPGASLDVAHAQFEQHHEACDQCELGKQDHYDGAPAGMRSVAGMMIG